MAYVYREIVHKKGRKRSSTGIDVYWVVVVFGSCKGSVKIPWEENLSF
jgi:hypothetical protein